MAAPRSLTRSMSQTVSYKVQTGQDVSNAPTWGSLQTNTQAKVWEVQEIARRGDGEELVTKHFVHTFTEIPKGAILWLPGADTDDDEEGHIVDYVDRFDSLAVRGTQWTIYVAMIGHTG